MGKATQKEPSLMDLAVVVIPRSRIESIRLANSTIRSQLEAPGIGEPLQVEFGFDATTKCDAAHNKLLIRTVFRVSARAKSNVGAAEIPMRIDAEFVALYSIDSLEGIEEKHLDAFARMNGIHNAWPYWREYVQSTTVRLGLPALVLPLMTGQSLTHHYNMLSQRQVNEPIVAAGGSGKAAPRERST